MTSHPQSFLKQCAELNSIIVKFYSENIITKLVSQFKEKKKLVLRVEIVDQSPPKFSKTVRGIEFNNSKVL